MNWEDVGVKNRYNQWMAALDIWRARYGITRWQAAAIVIENDASDMRHALCWMSGEWVDFGQMCVNENDPAVVPLKYPWRGLTPGIWICRDPDGRRHDLRVRILEGEGDYKGELMYLWREGTIPGSMAHGFPKSDLLIRTEYTEL